MSTSQRVNRGFDRLGLLALSAFSFVKRILAGVVLAVMLVGGAGAGPFEDGLAAALRGDDATAVRLWRPLAERGDAKAQLALGVMYKRGQGVPQDYAEAVKWYRRAAEQGNADAQYNLGIMYHDGEGVPQDYVQAHMWLNLAAARFPASDADAMNMAVQDRGLAASKMTPAQIAEAQKLAREWKPK